MTQSGTAINQYLHAIQVLQIRVIETQQAVLAEVAQEMAETTRTGKRIFLFGTGHSHLLAEEGFYRAGGLANVVPLLAEHLMLHHLPELGSRLERTPELADLILERYAPEPQEMLFIFSNSGVNRLPVEMAQRARAHELRVVSVSSFAYARQAPLSDLGVRLDQAVDWALDNGGIPGDALLELPGLSWRAAPSSTIVAALLWNCLVAETARLLWESGQAPPIFRSLNSEGAAQHNQKLIAHWRPRNVHL